MHPFTRENVITQRTRDASLCTDMQRYLVATCVGGRVVVRRQNRNVCAITKERASGTVNGGVKLYAVNIMTTHRLVLRHSGDMPLVRPTTALVDRVRIEWLETQDRPLLAFIATPLALTATALIGQWPAWGPLLGVAIIAMRHDPKSVALTAQLAFFGTAWAYDGATQVAASPDRLLAGALWAGFPLGLAVVGQLHRRHQDLPERGISLSGVPSRASTNLANPAKEAAELRPGRSL
jgi:hypothetical protein